MEKARDGSPAFSGNDVPDEKEIALDEVREAGAAMEELLSSEVASSAVRCEAWRKPPRRNGQVTRAAR